VPDAVAAQADYNLPIGYDALLKRIKTVVIDDLEIPVEHFDSADWWENDGAVPSYSQLYPRISGEHPVGGEFNPDTSNESFRKGKWYYQWERDVDHLDICASPQPSQIGWQRRFYKALFERLAALP
jgi:hypothetical protein